MRYGYIDNNGNLTCKDVDKALEDSMNVEEMLSNGYKPVDEIDSTLIHSDDPDYFIKLQPYDAGDRIAYHYIRKFDKQRIKNEIQSLKGQLANTDYQVTKCYEASLIGAPLPYDIQALYQSRQQMRDTINELEEKLANA